MAFFCGAEMRAGNFIKAIGADSSSGNFSTLNVYYGYKTYIHDFQHRFNTTANFKYGLPVQLIGIGESGYFAVNRNSNVYGHCIYSQVLPQTLHVNDSIKCRVTGFVFSAAYGAAFTGSKKHAMLICYIGFNTGRLRFYGDEQVRQKNPFFSPKIGLQPKLQIGRLDITLIAEAEYDVSKPGWRRLNVANADKVSIGRFKQSGYTMLAGIGYRFPARPAQDAYDKAQ